MVSLSHLQKTMLMLLLLAKLLNELNIYHNKACYGQVEMALVAILNGELMQTIKNTVFVSSVLLSICHKFMFTVDEVIFLEYGFKNSKHSFFT